MNLKTSTEQRWTLLALALLMGMTRFHHEGTAFALPDASLAVFFLGGLYLKSYRSFLFLLALGFAIDYIAITGFGVSDYCISPAYVFMVPTYGVMWLGGVKFSRLAFAKWLSYVGFLASFLVISASLAFVISNGSFFWFSDKVSLGNGLEYASSLSEYYLSYIGSTFIYVAMGVGMEFLLNAVSGLNPSKILNR
jgi:hypothetical protein